MNGIMAEHLAVFEDVLPTGKLNVNTVTTLMDLITTAADMGTPPLMTGVRIRLVTAPCLLRREDGGGRGVAWPHGHPIQQHWHPNMAWQHAAHDS